MNTIGRIAIIGVGLLGGSIGLALKKRGWGGIIKGIGRHEASLEKALAKGAIDEAYLDVASGINQAELIIICTPANLVTSMLDQIKTIRKDQMVVTDVASTKAQICDYAKRTWPQPLQFIGSHPIAGSEKYGPENASSDLYEGSVVIVESMQDWHKPEAYNLVCKFWTFLGAIVHQLDPPEHDIILARTSHVPHIAAAGLALLADIGKNVRPMLGGGFRDTTRIAAGSPAMWRDICLTNSEAIGSALNAYADKLKKAAEWIAARDPDSLERFFQDARDSRKRLLEE